MGYGRFLRMSSGSFHHTLLFRWSALRSSQAIIAPCLLVTGSFIRHIQVPLLSEVTTASAYKPFKKKKNWLCLFFLSYLPFLFNSSHPLWSSAVSVNLRHCFSSYISIVFIFSLSLSHFLALVSYVSFPLIPKLEFFV